MEATSSFQVKTLHPSDNADDYNLYAAALEWSLIEPIHIEGPEDLLSKPLWDSKLNPYEHQIKNLINFCHRRPVTLVADDVGLGKTITAGLILSELISRRLISRILIVCPKIIMPQWQEELGVKFGILAQGLVGNELNNIKFSGEQSVIITTYASARDHFDSIVKADFDMLILDEAHKLRNLYGVPTPPQVAMRFREALEDHIFKYVLMLTATPIQNRLWDLYSLIDLLTVARGDGNPFGTEGMFESNYLSDDRKKARKLKPEMEEKFRSIVYGYMSRIRRNEINLVFPRREVKLIPVERTPEEIKLFELLISGEFKTLDRWTQISLLKAYVSSPQALAKELEHRAEKKGVSREFASLIRECTKSIKISAKLNSLEELIDRVKGSNPDEWRVVIFTDRRETQTMIQSFLEGKGNNCGLINGDSHARNQETIGKFNKSPVDMHVIISTDAGSEGLNLQVANVMMNYDLPWNPMIVEQRIGRMQRLASTHATVTVLNITLNKTFETEIVGRLMEKLQMACHAIGDIESLLQSAGLNNEDDSESFEDKIRELVLASLAGKDIEQAIAQEKKNIEKARVQLDEQEQIINECLGDPSKYPSDGPKFPMLAAQAHSMDEETFISAALKKINMLNSENITEYKSSSSDFHRLVSKITATGLHYVDDADKDIRGQVQVIAKNWVNNFEGIYNSCSIEKTQRRFIGTALLRSRVTVAIDSYEKLIKVNCDPLNSDDTLDGVDDIKPLEATIKNLNSLRLSVDYLISMTNKDDSISEFCRFYKEKLVEKIVDVEKNSIQQKKLEDDFTPRNNTELVGVEGTVNRKVLLNVDYTIDGTSYKSMLTVVPLTNEILAQPNFEICNLTGKNVPIDCLSKCEISGKLALKNLFRKSEISGRLALPEFSLICALTGKRILSDEAENSAVTGKLIAKEYLKTSALSGKRAEPEFFGKCEFTSSEVLASELAVSQISGKHYRMDEQLISAQSGKTGHTQEFIFCAITHQPLVVSEGERCEVTDKIVMPGKLEVCEITGKKVLPTELEKSAFSGKKALKRFFVTSSLSGAHFLEDEAIRSSTGKFCLPTETKTCFWSGQNYHPDDLRVCEMTGLKMNFNYINPDTHCSEILSALLGGIFAKTDKTELWDSIAVHLAQEIELKNSKVVNAILSPDGLKLALRLEIKKWFGLKVEYKGFFYSIPDNNRVGRIVRVTKSAK